MALPGLGLTAPSVEEPEPFVQERQIVLAAGSEWRFEVSFSVSITLRVSALANSESDVGDDEKGANTESLLSDRDIAEIFGAELVPDRPYVFSGIKAAIYTRHGCMIAVAGGPCESDYAAEETPMTEYTNLHLALEGMRQSSYDAPGDTDSEMTGPRVLVLGPDNSGKSSLLKILSAYAVRSGHTPVVINLDPQESMLCLPGSISATILGPGAVMDVEDIASVGWGSSPIGGPSPVPIKMPLVYHYGFRRPDDRPDIFKPLITRLALAVTSRLEDDAAIKEAGLLIELPGKTSMDTVAHVVSELSVNVIVVLGSERLYSDVSRWFSRQATADEAVSVVKISKSGGCIDKDEAYTRAVRHAAIRGYFFGSGGATLSPHTQVVDASSLEILRVNSFEDATAEAFLPGGASEDTFSRNNGLFRSVSPNLGLQNAVLAVKHASPTEAEELIRDASVAGYLYIADVDEVKKKIKVLSPAGGKFPTEALVLGAWPEGVADLLG